MLAETPYRFNIINCEKPNSQFNFGEQELILWILSPYFCKTKIIQLSYPLHKKCPYSELFWSAIFPHFSVRMRKNAGKMWTRITPNTDTFYAVSDSLDILSKIVFRWIFRDHRRCRDWHEKRSKPRSSHLLKSHKVGDFKNFAPVLESLL